MNRFQLSPAARLVVSFALVIGILVAGQTHTFSPSAVQAQTGSEAVGTMSIGIGLSLPVSRGEVVGALIEARGVLIDGVPVDVVIPDRVRIYEGVVISGTFMSVNGVVISGTVAGPQDGVVISGTVEEEPPAADAGAPETVGAEIETQEVVISGGAGGVRLSGGEIQGDNLHVVNGVLYGENIRVVGSTVTGDELSVAGVTATVPGS